MTSTLRFTALPNLAETAIELYPEHPSLNSRVKRLLDIVGAIVGLSITAAIAVPVGLATLFTDLADRGPLFYSQTRIGYKGQEFRIWKFRSMVVDAEAKKHLVKNEAQGHIFKNENDPRVTKLGRFLRRTSLDEFPQFWNVLKGEMSLVGTRPPTPDEVEKYDAHHWKRLDVKPGITGEWQANGRSTVKDFEDIVALDLAYQEKWSVGYDIQLIWKTIQVVLKGSGAC